METQQTLVIKIALDSWYTHIRRADNLFNLLSDEQLAKEISPNRNRGIYLLGHLTAVHDRMLSLLDFEAQLYPALDAVFVQQPDKTFSEIPTAAELRSYWKTVNETLATHFESMPVNDWLKKHSAVSEEDFIKEPHRNKFGVLISRTNHLAYHFGQVALLK